MEYLRIAVEFVKAIAWPTAILTIVWWFYDELKKMIPKLVKFGPAGAEFAPGRQSLVLSAADLRELPGLTRTAAMGMVETNLHQALAGFPEEDRIDLLVRHLAQARLETTFERGYRAIFGSQIEGLKRARQAGGSVSRADAETYFNEIKAQFPDFYTNTPFEQWLAFLINTGLVSAQQANLTITDYGRDFLDYIESQGLPANKLW